MNIPKITKISEILKNSISNREVLNFNKLKSKILIQKGKKLFPISDNQLKFSRQPKEIIKCNSFISENNNSSRTKSLPKILKFSYNKENSTFLTNHTLNKNAFYQTMKSNKNKQLSIIPFLNINKPIKNFLIPTKSFLNKNNSTKNVINRNLKHIIIKKASLSKDKERISKSNTSQHFYFECYNPDNYKINKIYSFTQAGCLEDGTTKINQDSYIILTNIFNLNYNILGILDGHGNEGHLISQFIKDQIIKIFTLEETYITNQLNLKNEIDEEIIYSKLTKNNFSFIKKIFKSFDKILLKENFDSKNSGTTCVLLFQISKYIICANTGDSRCILIKKATVTKSINLKKVFNITYENLIKDHKPNNPEEKKRITSNGGIVRQSKNSKGKLGGVYRIFLKEKSYPGLAISRTIGDFDSKLIGNISEPDIKVKVIDDNFISVVLGSDGLWDVINGDDVINEIYHLIEKNNLDEIAENLVNNAIFSWKNESFERDDISIIVGFFNYNRWNTENKKDKKS